MVCFKYIASNAMKAEKGMLQAPAKEYQSETIRTQLKKIGSLFLNHPV